MNTVIVSPQMSRIANFLLLICCLQLIVLIPLYPEGLYLLVSRVIFSFIFLISVFLIDTFKKIYLYIIILSIISEWTAYYMDLFAIVQFFKIISAMVFCFIVVTLLVRVAQAKQTTPYIIVEAINGYLLLGILYSIVITLVVMKDPGSIINTSHHIPLKFHGVFSYDCVYYTFVSYTTVGYGDYKAITDIAKSTSILISMSGQLYLSIIIALIISKVSYQKS